MGIQEKIRSAVEEADDVSAIITRRTFAEQKEQALKESRDEFERQTKTSNLPKKTAEALKKGNNVLIHGDSSKIKSLDCCCQAGITSPPYGEQRKDTYGGEKDEDYPEWLVSIVENISPFIKPDGIFALNLDPGRGNDGFMPTYGYETLIALRNIGWRETQAPLYWIKAKDNFYETGRTIGTGGSKKILRKGLEPIYILARTANYYANTEDLMIPTGGWRESRKDDKETRTNSSTGSKHGGNRGKAAKNKWAYPNNLLLFSQDDKEEWVEPNNVLLAPTVPTRGAKCPMGHSAVWHYKVPEFFVKYASKPGDVILDPFVGSGQTISAAFDNGRLAIGIDKHPESIISALARLKLQKIPYVLLKT